MNPAFRTAALFLSCAAVSAAQDADTAQRIVTEGIAIREIRTIVRPINRPPAIGQAELQQILNNFEKRVLTSEDLARIRTEFVEAYRRKGYLTAVAVFEDQDVRDGRIVLTLYEGTPPRMVLVHNGWLPPGWFRSLLQTAPEHPLARSDLEARLRWLHFQDAIRRFDAVLTPEDAPGESRLTVDVERRFPVSFTTQFDNYIAPTVGSNRIVGTATVHSLLRRADDLRLTFGRSAGLKPLIGADWSIPLPGYKYTIHGGFRQNDFFVVETLFRPLDITSRSQIATMGIEREFRWNTRRNTDEALVIGVDAERSRNESYLLGEPFSFSPGVVNGRYIVSAFRLFQEFRAGGPDRSLLVRSRFSFGVYALGSTESVGSGDRAPDSRFISWLGQTQYLSHVRLFRLRPSEVAMRGDVQLSNRPLLPVEQMPVGGRNSVRGHRENELVRDQGIVGSVEWRTPVVRNRSWVSRLDVIPFIDAGRAMNKGASELQSVTIVGAGVGSRWTWSAGRRYEWRPSAEIFWAPFRYGRQPQGTTALQDRGIHFGLAWSGS